MAPALAAVAVNVTCVPLQIVVADAAVLTVGAVTGLTVTTVAGEVAVAGEAQPDDDVITTRIVSLLFSVPDVNVLPLPCAVPFTYH